MLFGTPHPYSDLHLVGNPTYLVLVRGLSSCSLTDWWPLTSQWSGYSGAVLSPCYDSKRERPSVEHGENFVETDERKPHQC